VDKQTNKSSVLRRFELKIRASNLFRWTMVVCKQGMCSLLLFLWAYAELRSMVNTILIRHTVPIFGWKKCISSLAGFGNSTYYTLLFFCNGRYRCSFAKRHYEVEVKIQHPENWKQTDTDANSVDDFNLWCFCSQLHMYTVVLIVSFILITISSMKKFDMPL
jgi:hypothetical protein